MKSEREFISLVIEFYEWAFWLSGRSNHNYYLSSGVVSMHWVCSVCGYQHDDEEQPSSCPVCSSGQNKFNECYDDDGSGASGSSNGDDMDDFEKDLFADYDDQ